MHLCDASETPTTNSHVARDWLGQPLLPGTRVIWKNGWGFNIGRIVSVRPERQYGRNPGPKDWVLDVDWELQQPYLEMTAEPGKGTGRRVRIENVTAWPLQDGDPRG